MRASLALLAAAVLAIQPLCDCAQAGQNTQSGATAADPDSPKARVKELRKERQEAKEWITVPELDRETLLVLLDDPAVVILDVTCKERGAKIPDQIPRTIWRDCDQVAQWAPEYRKDQTIVVY